MRRNEIFVDNFAGGGGASTGIEIAIGRNVDIAINHDPDAIAMHRANHPKQFNIFLKQCGYVRYNDNIFMEDITDEEYEALSDFLDELREEKKSCVSQ